VILAGKEWAAIIENGAERRLHGGGGSDPAQFDNGRADRGVCGAAALAALVANSLTRPINQIDGRRSEGIGPQRSSRYFRSMRAARPGVLARAFCARDGRSERKKNRGARTRGQGNIVSPKWRETITLPASICSARSWESSKRRRCHEVA